MIKGIGVDIIEIARIKSAMENPAFLEKLFTPAEMSFIGGRTQTAAGLFAAKEAVAKSLGTGFSGFGLRDAEILEDPNGKPFVTLHNGAKTAADEKGVRVIHISVSHSKEYAVAVAYAEGVVDE